jgi:hypothetical protein
MLAVTKFEVKTAPKSGPVGTSTMLRRKASSRAIAKGIGSFVVIISIAAVLSLTAREAKVVWSASDFVDSETASSQSSIRIGFINAIISFVKYTRQIERTKADSGEIG